jgi:hypothetical protein
MTRKKQRKLKTVITPEFRKPAQFPALSSVFSPLVIASEARNVLLCAGRGKQIPRCTRNDKPLASLLLPLALFALFLAQVRPAHASPGPPGDKDKKEKPYALIYGTVWGPDDRPMYGVPVKIRRASEKKARWELYSDHNGEFALRVPAGKGDYVIWADVKSLKLTNGSHLQPGEPAQVHVEYDERVDTGLHLKVM